MHESDFCFRVDIKRIVTIMAAGGRLAFAENYNYLSTGGLDIIGKAFEDTEVDRLIHPRRNSNNEGELDLRESSLSNDIEQYAAAHESASESIVIIAGSSSYVPAVKRVLAKGWHVDLYAYDNCKASEFNKLKESYHTFRMESLDKLFQHRGCHFENRRWNPNAGKIPDSSQVGVFVFSKEFRIPGYYDHHEEKHFKDLHALRNLTHAVTQMLHISCRFHYCTDAEGHNVVFIINAQCTFYSEVFKSKWVDANFQKHETCKRLFHDYGLTATLMGIDYAVIVGSPEFGRIDMSRVVSTSANSCRLATE